MPLQHAQPDPRVADVVRSQLVRLSGTPPVALNALAGSAPAELSMEAPQQVYILGLDQVSAGSGPDAARASGWRYLLRQDSQTVATAQTTTDAAGAPVFAEFNSGPFVQSIADTLQRAERVAGAAGGGPLEPRLLHVPALHAMALWLHGDKNVTDIVLPLEPAPPTVHTDMQYSIEDYMVALREAAATARPVGIDDTTGG